MKVRKIVKKTVSIIKVKLFIKNQKMKMKMKKKMKKKIIMKIKRIMKI